MRTYTELKALIEKRGVHPEFGDVGEGWAIEQNPHELATFLVAMQALGVQSCLEIGTGYKGGLSRFLAAELGWQVTSVDVVDYGHKFEGVHYMLTQPRPAYHIGFGYKFDLVFIDGAHDYQNVREDYYDYAPYATKAIAFHDIVGLRMCEAVKLLWVDLANKAGRGLHKQAIDENSERRAGIGWIVL